MEDKMLCVVSPTCFCITIVCPSSDRDRGAKRGGCGWEDEEVVVDCCECVCACVWVRLQGKAQTARGNLTCVPWDVWWINAKQLSLPKHHLIFGARGPCIKDCRVLSSASPDISLSLSLCVCLCLTLTTFCLPLHPLCAMLCLCCSFLFLFWRWIISKKIFFQHPQLIGLSKKATWKRSFSYFSCSTACLRFILGGLDHFFIRGK